MEAKIEHPRTPPPPPPPQIDHFTPNLWLQELIQRLEKGRESVHHMGTIHHHDHHREYSHCHDDDDDHDHHKGLLLFDDHLRVAFASLDWALSALQSCDFAEDLKRAIKIRTRDGNPKSEDSNGETPKSNATTPKDRRGCYKRRRTGESKTIETANLTDDGHAWRKYGQKAILNTEHPRNYYRCTHKHDQGCQATKQVQQISENPTKYKITYQGQHCCKNPLKAQPIIFLESPEIDDDDEVGDQSSPLYLSFESNIPFISTSSTPFLFSPSSTSALPGRMGPTFKEEQGAHIIPQSQPHDQCCPSSSSSPPPSSDDDHHHRRHYSLSSSSSDPTATTPASDQRDVISSSSTAEIYSCVASPYPMDDRDLDLYNYLDIIGMGDTVVSEINDWESLMLPSSSS